MTKDRYIFSLISSVWQLIDTEDNKVLYKFPDPVDDILNDPSPCETLADVKDIVNFELDWEKEKQENEYKGMSDSQIHARIPFDCLPVETADIMAKALYNYYVA